MAQTGVLSLYDTKYRNLFSFSPDKVMEFFFLSKTNPFAQELVSLSPHRPYLKYIPYLLYSLSLSSSSFPPVIKLAATKENKGSRASKPLSLTLAFPLLPSDLFTLPHSKISQTCFLVFYLFHHLLFSPLHTEIVLISIQILLVTLIS